nr:immunoglobulin heavy chain junction region [Macaca mulatta]
CATSSSFDRFDVW